MSEFDEASISASKERLLSPSLSDYEDAPLQQVQKPCRHKYFWALMLGFGLSLMLNFGLLDEGITTLYSPANDAVEYRLTKFASSVEGGETDFQGRPSAKSNQAWKSLYENSFTHITKEEAQILPNKTAPELESEGSGYLVVLNVFHDLHCMDNIRKGLYYFLEPQWNSTHNPYILHESPEAALEDRGGDHLSIMHLDHCIDSLRQSIQCTGDVVPNVFQYSPKYGGVRARSTVVHECRNFNKIQEWAAERHVPGPFKDFGKGPELGKCGIDDPWTCLTPVSLAAAILALINSILIVGLIYVEHDRSIRPSKLISIYLSLSSLVDLAQARSLFLQQPNTSGRIGCVFVASLATKFILVLLEEIPKQRKPGTSSKEEISGPLNRSVFGWLSSLFIRGSRGLLAVDDLGIIDRKFDSARLLSKLSSSWDRCDKSAKHALLKSTFSAFRISYVAPILPRLCLAAFNFSQPFLIKRIIEFVAVSKHAQYHEIAGGLIGACFLIYLGLAISRGIYNHAVYQLTTTLRGGLVSVIFCKSLELDAATATKAEAITLMSTDIDSIASGVKDLHEIWASVLELGVAVYLLNLQIDAACFVVMIPAVVLSFVMERATDGIGPARMAWNEGVQERVSITSSMLSQIKGVKMMGLANYFAKTVQHLRVKELDMSKKFRVFIVRIILISNLSDQMTPAVVVTAAVFWTRADGFTVSQAFTSLAIVALVSTPLANLIGSYPTFVSSVACFGRVQEFLVQEERRSQRLQDADASERKPSANTPSISDNASHPASHDHANELKEMQQIPGQSDIAISLDNVTVCFEGKEEPILRGITLSIPRHKYTEVTGVVGCGKSTFLKVILGEISSIGGYIRFKQPNVSVAFCEQTVWLRNISVMDNIIGQERFDKEWYGCVVFACDLKEDISRMPEGDRTLVGSGGITLSGGQKQRVALARAVYARRSIILLDDPFSALDAETRAKVFSRLLGEEGLLRKGDATVVHAIPAGPRKSIADKVILLNKTGSVEQAGPSINLATAFKDIDFEHRAEDSTHQDENATVAAETPQPKAPKVNDEDATQRQSGDFSLYRFYLQSIGPALTITFILFAATYIFLGFMPNIWLRIWTDHGTNDGSRGAYFGAYLAFCIGTVLFSGLAIGIFFVVVIPHSAARLHWQLLDSVLKAPLWFFTTVDSGVTLNRFSQDMTLVDQTLPTAFFEVVLDTLVAIASAALIASGAQYFAAIIPFCVLPLYFLQKFYLKTSRQMRHLDLECKSPLYTHFTETLNGVVTIRAFGWQQEFVKEQLHLLDVSQKPYYMLFCIQRWLAIVLDLFVTVIATALVAFAVKFTNTTSGGAIGLSMVSLMGLNSSLSRLISSWTNLETSLGAIARLRDFVRDTPHEDNIDDQSLRPIPPGWPSSGAITFQNINAKYKTDDEDILRDLSLSIKAGQKVGICGRTGRQVFPLLDEVDLCLLSRDAIRPHLITLPQDPVTLPGTIRTNLDPYELCDSLSGEKVMLEALQKTFLWDDVIKPQGGLDAKFTDVSLSHGQQQLFALARAILHKDSSIVVLLDEATSSVDHETDTRLQKVIRDELASHTVLAVAHRLDTIKNYDVVVVMDKVIFCRKPRCPPFEARDYQGDGDDEGEGEGEKRGKAERAAVGSIRWVKFDESHPVVDFADHFLDVSRT
ncbi:ABC multidrug transporter [Colletotrichum karsti]|uniref:ABC multidrug transporter n=1 Tax=Colletotrichum karsti TaxID=1095194 RepID=A0A9P6IGB2_9PEZI|nr:ABC multidrug transporter [Colletotrichum karsti]KAF9882288.1 ABC multidrug transporter [Colletotrichum karsti]